MLQDYVIIIFAQDISKEFERNYTDMVNHLIEAVQAKLVKRY